MKDNILMKLNIQLFAEDNEEIVDEAENIEDIEEGTEEESPENVDDSSDAAREEEIDKTKSFSKRLNEKTQEIKTKVEQEYVDKMNKMARLRGFDTWEDFEKAAEEDTLMDAGVNDIEKFKGVLQTLIEKNPQVVKAKEIIENSEKERKEKLVNDEVKLIGKLDPSITCLDDISKLDNISEITDKLNKGYSLYDSYLLCNYNKIQTSKIENEKIKAASSVQSKEHMKKSSGGKGEFIEIPKDVLAMYKRNLPKWTEEQIKNDYNARVKGGI